MKNIKKEIYERANHFYKQAKLSGELQTIKGDIQALLNGIVNKSVFRQLLHLEHVSFEEKVELFEQELGHLAQCTKEYVAPYLSKEGLDSFIDSLESFLEIYEGAKLELISAVELTEEEQARIVEAFQKKVGKEYDVCVNVVNPDVIGGVKVKSREHLIDGTILYQLNQFKQHVISHD